MYHVLCCDETLCLPGSVGCPLNPVERLLVLPFSRFLQFNFLILLRLSLKTSCVPSTSCRANSVSFSSMIMPALSLSLHMYYVIIFMKFPLATRLQFPSCTCCFVYGALHYVDCLLLHLILLLLSSYRCTVCSTGYP